jgi:putative Holliday junction resolvase
MARILGLDVGERRIGVAISDPDERLAVPLRIIERQNDASAAQSIAEITEAEHVATIVVGNPISMNGSIGPQAKRVQAFAERVAGATGLPLELCDERLTSRQAVRGAPGTSRKAARSGPADDVAAAIILQTYLDRRRAGPTP